MSNLAPAPKQAAAINARSQLDAAAYVNRLAPMVFRDALRTDDPDIRRKNFDSLKAMADADAKPMHDDKANLPTISITMVGGLIRGDVVRAAPGQEDVVDVQAKEQATLDAPQPPMATDAFIDSVIAQAQADDPAAPKPVVNPLPPLDPSTLPDSLEALNQLFQRSNPC